MKYTMNRWKQQGISLTTSFDKEIVVEWRTSDGSNSDPETYANLESLPTKLPPGKWGQPARVTVNGRRHGLYVVPVVLKKEGFKVFWAKFGVELGDLPTFANMRQGRSALRGVSGNLIGLTWVISEEPFPERKTAVVFKDSVQKGRKMAEEAVSKIRAKYENTPEPEVL
jgi:hypothetical protein